MISTKSEWSTTNSDNLVKRVFIEILIERCLDINSLTRLVLDIILQIEYSRTLPIDINIPTNTKPEEVKKINYLLLSREWTVTVDSDLIRLT